VNNLPDSAVQTYKKMQTYPICGGTPDAKARAMKADTQARIRRIFTREFYRRGRMTWDMKMALRGVFQGR
jgi:hypothetical protein